MPVPVDAEAEVIKPGGDYEPDAFADELLAILEQCKQVEA